MLLGYSGGIILLLISILFFLIKFSSLPPFLPIYNKMPWGYARLGTKIEMLIPLGIAMFFYSLNIMVSSKIYHQQPLLSRLIAMVSFFVSLISCIFALKIVSLVI